MHGLDFGGFRKLEKGLLMSSNASNKRTSTLPTPPANIVWHQGNVSKARREAKNGHRGAVLWFTGLSGSGKSTLAHAVEDVLHQRGYQTFVLDGDNVRHNLCADLGFSRNDRAENMRRVSAVTKLFIDAGMIVLTAFISPYRDDREGVRKVVGQNNFMEIYCNASLDVCESRDIKGLYKKAREGLISEFTGISAPYETPISPDLIINTDTSCLEDCVNKVIEEIMRRGICELKLDSILQSDSTNLCLNKGSLP